MRRNDRELTDQSEIIQIIEKCDVCRLALSKDNVPYIVPMNFGYEYVDGRLTLYFHCAPKGKKLDIIHENPAACFEMDCSTKLIEGEIACKYSMSYESVIGTGTIAFCNDHEEKGKALALIMKTYAPDKNFVFTESQTRPVTIFKLCVDQLTGKRRS